IRYSVLLDDSWRTVRARVVGASDAGTREVELEAGRDGTWRIDGEAAPHLTCCIDVDLEASVVTNALPVHRLDLRVGQEADVPGAYVRASGLMVERLEQSYVRLADRDGRQHYRYHAPAFDFECELVYDRAGLVVHYPGIAV